MSPGKKGRTYANFKFGFLKFQKIEIPGIYDTSGMIHAGFTKRPHQSVRRRPASGKTGLREIH
jgi:hypothetical protein